MFTEKIIISQKSLDSQTPSKIIDSNIQYITKLFQNNIHDSNICEDSLKSYYIDYYLSHILHGGFSNFIEHIESRPKTLYYIKEGLKSIGAQNHLELLIHAIQIDSETLQSFSLFNTLFSEFQEKENLLELNSQWIVEHKNLYPVKENRLNEVLNEHIGTSKSEDRPTKIIKELCSIANEEFIRITVGENNNLYNDGAWYFKTDRGYYYMVEKNHLVTMYNSQTKEPVVRGKITSTHSLTKGYKSILTKFLG